LSITHVFPEDLRLSLRARLEHCYAITQKISALHVMKLLVHRRTENTVPVNSIG